MGGIEYRWGRHK